MIKVHRAVVERLGPGPVHGVLLDTPFGFQTNAPDIAARAVDYFRDSVGATLEVAGLRSAADLEPPGGDAVIARLAAAPLRLLRARAAPPTPSASGAAPWSPPSWPRSWPSAGRSPSPRPPPWPSGVVAVPVYEVYKVGEEARWIEGLDLLGPLGLHVALIPHYDNAEGGTHDTRFSYLGEERLAELEDELPDGVFVLGVDEHTALCLDLDAGTALVAGHGGVTVRARGRSTPHRVGPDRCPSTAWPRWPTIWPTAGAGAAGATPVIGSRRRAPGVAAVGCRRRRRSGPATAHRSSKPSGPTRQPSGPAATAVDAAAMVAAILALEDEMWSWRADTLQSDEMDRGRAALRTMVSRVGSGGRSGHPGSGHRGRALRGSGSGSAGRGPRRRPLRRCRCRA